jgi:tetratricopeptide (TPR) repeat protein
MFKKLLIVAIVLAFVGVSSIPMWTSRMADDAFKNPQRPISAEAVSKAIKTQMYIFLFEEARKTAEKGVIYFPESKEVPNYMYNAAMCAEKIGNMEAAIYWFSRFTENYPDHIWADQAKRTLDRAKNMNNPH